MKHLVLIFFLFSVLQSFAQSSAARVNMAKTDITALPDFDGAKAEFYGFYIGITKAEALRLLKSRGDFSWEFEEYNTKSENPNSKEEMRIYAYVKGSSLEDSAALYLIWDEGKTGLQSLVFYDAVGPMLAGNTSQLFTMAALENTCECRKFLHGTPEQKTDNIGITTQTFPKQHFQLISYESAFGGTRIHFALFADGAR